MSKPKRTVTKWVLVGLFLLVANVWAQYLLWFGEQGLVRWRQTEKQLQVLKKENRQIEKRISRIKEEILLGENEDILLEEVARRDLGMVYPDEIIFIDPPK
ncbi:MAG: septum formation initiator family protein [Magnetococcales bacterium]|nr:septum formation initiator family protein [Magnetococcales bacterium]